MNHICVQDIGTKVSIGLSFFLISNYKYNLNMYHMCVVCLVAQLCPTLCDRMDCTPPGSSVYGDSPRKNTRVGCHALLQGIFPTQGSNPGLSHGTWILYRLSHQGSPRILEWVDYPFSRGFSWWRNWTRVSCVASQADSLPGELPEKPRHKTINSKYRKQTARQSS